MNDIPRSFQQLGEWMATYRDLTGDDNATEGDLSAHLDRLGIVIDSLAIDFERNGIDSAPVRQLSQRQAAYERRPLDLREPIIAEMMALFGRLEGKLTQEPPPPPKPVDPFRLHCLNTTGSHRDKANAWLAMHPEDKRTTEQVKRASERIGQPESAKAD